MNQEVPKLTIGELSFELEQGFSDGYHNEFAPPKGMYWRTHPVFFFWMGGSFKPIKIQMNLAVGVQSILDTPQKLVNTLAKLESYALLTENKIGAKPAVIPLTVGTWFARKGYIEDIDFTYEAPWDVSTGMPMKATVVINFISDFLTNVPVITSQLTPMANDILRSKFIQMGPSSAMGSAGDSLSKYDPFAAYRNPK